MSGRFLFVEWDVGTESGCSALPGSWAMEKGTRVVRVLKTLLPELWFLLIFRMKALSLSEWEGGRSQGKLKTH